MDLSRVWVICRSGSQSAMRTGQRIAEQLRSRHAEVDVSTSGLNANPYPGLLADERLPDLVLVLW